MTNHKCEFNGLLNLTNPSESRGEGRDDGVGQGSDW